MNADKILKALEKQKKYEDLCFGIRLAKEERERELEFTKSEALYKGEKRGIAIGEALGRKIVKVMVAKNLLKRGYPEKDISEVTKLSLSEINAIKLNLI